MKTAVRFAPTLFALATLLFSACSKPEQTVIPSDMAKWDTELVPAMKKLNEQDREKVTAYLMRAKLGEVFGGKGLPPGVTIADALEQQKKFEAEAAEKRAQAEALKKKLEQERQAVVDQINKAVTVTLLEKKQLPKNYDAGRYREQQVIRIGAQNNTDRVIVGVKGELRFIDIFDKEVGNVNFGISEKIQPGKSVTWTGSRDYNEFIREHRAVWDLEEGKYKTTFVPDAIVFEDGTKLKTPD